MRLLASQVWVLADECGRYLIRRERGGPVVYRVELMHTDDWLVIPPEAYTHDHPAYIGSPMLAHDCLYNHFQIEKFTGEHALLRL